MDKKEVIFVLLNNFADWEGAYISTCLNMGVKPGCPIKYKVKTLSLSKEPITSIGGFRVYRIMILTTCRMIMQDLYSSAA